MPQYDYQCLLCRQIRLDVTVSNWRDADGRVELCGCGGTMVKQPSAPHFMVKGYNASNGYGRKE